MSKGKYTYILLLLYICPSQIVFILNQCNIYFLLLSSIFCCQSVYFFIYNFPFYNCFVNILVIFVEIFCTKLYIYMSLHFSSSCVQFIFFIINKEIQTVAHIVCYPEVSGQNRLRIDPRYFPILWDLFFSNLAIHTGRKYVLTATLHVLLFKKKEELPINSISLIYSRGIQKIYMLPINSGCLLKGYTKYTVMYMFLRQSRDHQIIADYDYVDI